MKSAFGLALAATALGMAVPATSSAANATPTPGASEFARVVLSTTTAYAEAHGGTARITNVDCVQASPGHYMCSYAVNRPDDAGECHLMQATWPPNGASTYAVTLAGRVHRCRTLREALRSLR